MRKFECPFCNYVKNFYGKEAKKFRKRVAGFTCPRCGKKVTDKDIERIKGKGPKPKGERRKRIKKEVVKEMPKALVPQPYIEQFDWKTRDPPAPGEPRSYAVRAGWHPRPPQPTERTLEEAVVEAFLSNPKHKRRK